LSLLAVDFPKTHDISRLIHLLPDRVKPDIKIKDQELLTNYAVITCYPGEEDPVTCFDAKQALSIAHKIRQSVRRHLPIRQLKKLLKARKT